MWPTAGFVRLAALLALSSVLTTCGFASSASAVDTIVSAQVCQANASSSLYITDPASDSLYTQPGIAVAGNVSNVTQVDIYIDGDYTRTVAVAQNSSQFQTSVMLPPGTHTIRASGIALCGGGAVEDEVVVTYRAPAQPTTGAGGSSSESPATGNTVQTITPPSYGSDLPTVINPEIPRGGGGVDGGDGGVVNDAGPSSQDTSQDEKLSFFERLWRTVGGSWLGRWLGIDPYRIPAPYSLCILWLRSFWIIIGLIFLIFGRRLVNFVERIRNAIDSRQRLIDYMIRCLGIFLILVSLAFV